MGNSIQVPNNIEDTTVLKRFLTDLVMGINRNTLFSGNVQEQNAAIVEILQSNPTMDFMNIVAKLNELRSNILTYVEDNLETVILQNTKDVALIAEQFGTFYEQALAASWYGLSVKAGGAIAGLEVGSLDPDVTTPGDESSYFRVIANNFILGRAYEDLTQAEKDYLAANNLPAFGTVYNAQKQPVPALVTTWDGANSVYKHYFNGVVQFSNIQGADYANAINAGTTTINGGKITTNSIEASKISSYNLTSNNATFENGIITNAKIADGSITNAKITDGSITNAKIANASIDNAKIQDLSVSTFKIQDEAVIVPRFSSGSGSCTIVYTPAVSHNVLISVYGGPLSGATYTYRKFFLNGELQSNKYQFYAAQGSGFYYDQFSYYLWAGTTYTFRFENVSMTIQGDGPETVINLEAKMTMLGVKK